MKDRIAELRRIPRTIWALGFVSLLMDASSELIHSLLPIFMVASLGASMAMVGLIEGVAEATALITKVFSGVLSDYTGRRKWLTVIGYGAAALTKPLFPLADSLGLVVTARFIDRIGKGIRGAPRDALIGDIAPPEIRGACFGLRQSLDTVGAFIGPLLAIGLMLAFSGQIRLVLWLAVIPAALALAVLIFGVKEPDSVAPAQKKPGIEWAAIRHIGRPFWQLLAVAGVLTLARFSEAFLLLKARELGLADHFVPLVMVVMSLAYLLSAYPAGRWSDGRADRYPLILLGTGVLIAANVALANAHALPMLALGAVLWGLHMGLTQGVLATIVTDVAPPAIRGTAYGLFNLVCGLAMLLASLIAGLLWDNFGSQITFSASAGFAILALAGLGRFRRK